MKKNKLKYVQDGKESVDYDVDLDELYKIAVQKLELHRMEMEKYHHQS